MTQAEKNETLNLRIAQFRFYSFWPWIVKKTKSVLTVTTILLLSLIMLKLLLRYMDIKSNYGNISLPYEIIHTTRFQCMLIGAIGAILLFQKNILFIKITDNLFSQMISWFVIFLVAINKFHIASVLDQEFVSLITVFLIIGQIRKSNRIFNLEIPFFDFIGKISYGIYVFHPLIIFYLSKILIFHNSSFLNYSFVYFSVFLITISLSYFSYQYFEKRFLSLKHKYSTITSQSALTNN